jgi:hypothetical protein
MNRATKQTTMRSGRLLWVLAVALSITLGAGSSAFADEPHRGGEHFASRGPEGFHGAPGRGQVLDNRYNHGGYYPAHGAMVRELPGGYRPYFYHGSHYYFSGGVWYAPGPAGFRVVGAPIGLFVATLPAFYTTVWFGGVPYYYANDAYYQWQADQNGYVVVNAPAGADQPGTPPPGPGPAPADNAYIYPKNGQTPEQQSADRYECHDWAKSQTGFDPTQPGGGVAPGDNGSRREQYQRAMGACLEARGYSVK